MALYSIHSGMATAFGGLELFDGLLLLIEIAGELDFGLDGARFVAKRCTLFRSCALSVVERSSQQRLAGKFFAKAPRTGSMLTSGRLSSCAQVWPAVAVESPSPAADKLFAVDLACAEQLFKREPCAPASARTRPRPRR